MTCYTFANEAKDAAVFEQLSCFGWAPNIRLAIPQNLYLGRNTTFRFIQGQGSCLQCVG